MRNLATVQEIINLGNIKNADSLEVATVLGWKVVVRKDEFQKGSKVIYCEIDSLFPDFPEFEFLKPRGMRIKTIRLRGQVSQGICFPVSLVTRFGLNPDELSIGQDVSDVIGIKKWEPAIPKSLAGKIKGSFPSFIPKTDETRVQVLQGVLDKYKGLECFTTEKLDGSSVTFYMKDGVLGVCSRNLDLTETSDNIPWIMARSLDIENKLKSLGTNCAIQGELIGDGIQKNKYKMSGKDIRFFNLFYIDEFKYASLEDFKTTMEKLQLKTVPILDENFTLVNDIDELVQLSIGKSKLYDCQREGIVICPKSEIVDCEIGGGLLHADRISFKAINPEFLLKFSE